MSVEPEIDIRYSRPMDAAYLKEWLTQEAVSKWFPMSTPAEIDAAVATWMLFCRYQAGLTATINHVPCAMSILFLMPYKKISHHAPFKLCVDPKYWGKGIGSSLLKNTKHLAKTYFKLDAIHIEVFGDNPLIALLEKFDFHPFAKQENYVKVGGLYQPRTCLISELTENPEDLQ